MNFRTFKSDIQPPDTAPDTSQPVPIHVESAQIIAGLLAEIRLLEAENIRLEQLCLGNFTNWVEARKQVDKIRALLDTHVLTAGVLWCRVREVLNAADMGDGHG